MTKGSKDFMSVEVTAKAKQSNVVKYFTNSEMIISPGEVFVIQLPSMGKCHLQLPIELYGKITLSASRDFTPCLVNLRRLAEAQNPLQIPKGAKILEQALTEDNGTGFEAVNA